MIIALSGYARSGKDTAAEGLVQAGFRRVAFADVLRDFLYRLNPVITVHWTAQEVRLQEVIDEFGWDGYKESPYGDEIRQLLQRLGTECGRELIGENVWVDAAFKDVKDDENIVITDMRFLNEKSAVESRGGITIRISRPGVGPANNHSSETSLDEEEFYFSVTNDGSVTELWEKMESIVRAVTGTSH